jgi:hypothetical protein
VAPLLFGLRHDLFRGVAEREQLASVGQLDRIEKPLIHDKL